MPKLLSSLAGIFRRVDWRAWVVLDALAVTLVATATIYILGIGLDPATHFGAVFAGWVSGVALFVVLGVVVAVVSLEPTEKGSFDARARILFRRQTGKHIDYIIRRINQILEHYNELSTITVTISKFDNGENKYKIGILHSNTIRSYIDDVESTYETPLEYIKVTPPPPGGDPNRLLYVRVDDTPTEASCTFESEIKRPVKTKITGDKSASVSYHLEVWILADTEPSHFKCSRYTQLFTLHFENLLQRPVAVHLAKVDGTSENQIVINPGEKKLAVELRDREPDAVVSDFRILAS